MFINKLLEKIFMVVINMGSCILLLSLNKKINDNKNGSYSLTIYCMTNIGLSKHFELIVI